MFTNDELKNIKALIGIAPIKGTDALTVALLLQKIESLLVPEPKEEKKDGKGK